MSRRRRPPPLTYAEFRTGYTFRDVYHMIYGRKHKRRRGVLGYWRELKKKLYKEYIRQYEESEGQPEFKLSDEEVPW